jgi:hypothetical protein
MRHGSKEEARMHRNGNIFARHSGSMIIHAQRENGLAHRTIVLHPWQVQVLWLLTSRWVIALTTVVVLGGGYLGIQAARVPVLLIRQRQMEQNYAQLDSLQRTVLLLQARYEQVQRMLAAPVAGEREKQARRLAPPLDSPHEITPVQEQRKQP